MKLQLCDIVSYRLSLIPEKNFYICISNSHALYFRCLWSSFYAVLVNTGNVFLLYLFVEVSSIESKSDGEELTKEWYENIFRRIFHHRVEEHLSAVLLGWIDSKGVSEGCMKYM